jgi:hypothetical protein
MSELWVEAGTCDSCGGPAAVMMKRDYANGGIPLPAIRQRMRCDRGCIGLPSQGGSP